MDLSSKGLILLVDDEVSNLAVMSDVLISNGYECATAKDVEMGWNRAHWTNPDLILLDVKMPTGTEGFELCRRLKTDEATRDIPVIFMTIASDQTSRVTGFEVGGIDYITKPFDVHEVLARVETHINLYRLRRELATKNLVLQQEMAERQQTQATLQSILDASPVGIGLVKERTIIWGNQMMANLLGVTNPEDMVNQPIRPFYTTQEEYDRVGQMLYTSLGDNGVGEAETEFPSVNGNEVTRCVLNTSPLTGDDPAQEGYILTLSDVTHRRKAELALRSSELRFREFFSQATLGLALTDSDHKILMWNDGLAQITGLASKDVVGQYIWEIQYILEHSLTSETPLPVDALALYRTEWLQNFETSLNQVQENSFQKVGGEEVFFSQQSFIIDTPSQFLYGVIVIDITAQKMADREIINLQRDLTTATEIARLGQIKYHIPSKKFKLSADLPGVVSSPFQTERSFDTTTIQALVYPDDIHIFQNQIMAQLEKGEESAADLRLIRADGSLVYVYVHFNISFDDAGKPIEAFGIVQDITERKQIEHDLHQAQQDAEQANAAKSDFLARMSHELRTPLNATIGYAQLMAREGRLSTEDQHYVESIQSSGKHLLSLLEEILDLSKIEAGKIDIHFRPFRLHTFVRNLADMIRLHAESKYLKFTNQLIDINGEPPPVNTMVVGDEQRLKQVALNLLTNAVKFTESGSVGLRVSLRPDGGQTLEHLDDAEGTMALIRFEVQDTGVGITKKDLEHIFDPFEQGEAGAHKSGTGLGLAISRNLVRLMGGTRIHVISDLGDGSLFWFEVPVKINRYAAGVGTAQVRRIHADCEPPLVLVVDDNHSSHEVITALLRKAGFAVENAYDAQTALQSLHVLSPDVIISDIFMPQVDGLAFVHQARKQISRPDMVYLAASAGVIDPDLRQQIEAHFTDFIPKPIDYDLLLNKLAQYLDVEWEYQPIPAHTPIVRAAEVLPDLEIINKLLYWAEIGHVGALTESLTELRQTNPELDTFVDRAAAFVQDYNPEGLARFLQGYL